MQVDPQADPVTQSEQAAEALDPTVSARQVKMRHFWYQTGQTYEREYTQAEIGFIPVQRLFTEISRELKKIVNGEFGIKLGDLFNGNLRQMLPEDAEGLDETVAENLQLIEAFFNLVEVVPELQNKIIALSLGVPRNEVQLFLDAIEEPPHRGGLTIEDGFEILNWFIRQNAVAIRRYFQKHGRELVANVELWVVHQGVKPPAKEIVVEAQEDQPLGGKHSSTSWQGTPENVT